MPFGYSFKPRLFVKNNARYNAVRNAATTYASVLNKYPLPARTPNAIKEINAAKSNLQLKINMYMENIPAGVPPPAPGFFSRFRRAPPVRIGEMPAPGAPRRNIAGAFGPLQPSPVNKQINGARVRANAATTNYQPANVFLYQGKFFSPHNGRYTEVKRNGMTGANFTKYKAGNINGRYNRQNVNGKPVFTPFTGENPENTANRIQFGKFMIMAPSIGSNTVNKQAKNYLNGNNRYRNNSGPVNFNAVRRITKYTNSNAATRGPFWAAVNAEMARRFKNLAAFKTYYARNAMRMQPNNQARAQRYLREFNAANNAGKRAMGGFITKNNNNNANRKKNGGFWNAVGEEGRRAAAP